MLLHWIFWKFFHFRLSGMRLVPWVLGFRFKVFFEGLCFRFFLWKVSFIFFQVNCWHFPSSFWGIRFEFWDRTPGSSFISFWTLNHHHMPSEHPRVWLLPLCFHWFGLLVMFLPWGFNFRGLVSFGFFLYWWFRFIRFCCPRTFEVCGFIGSGDHIGWHGHPSTRRFLTPWCFRVYLWGCWVLTHWCVKFLWFYPWVHRFPSSGGKLNLHNYF